MAATNSPIRRHVVTRVRRQHDTIRRLFDDIEAASPARRAEAFQPLVRLLAVHETAEEMACTRRCCRPDPRPPTHAHRFAPESATDNLLLDPAVALVDRVRDMLATTPSARTRS